jgi:hypothetical protein
MPDHYSGPAFILAPPHAGLEAGVSGSTQVVFNRDNWLPIAAQSRRERWCICLGPGE